MFLDIAFLVALALASLKVVDFVLLPDQQKAINAFFEDAAKWADDVDTERLKARIHEEGIGFLFLLFAWFAMGIGIIPGLIVNNYIPWATLYSSSMETVSQYVPESLPRSGRAFDPTPILRSFLVSYLISYVASLLIILSFWRWPLRILSQWTLGSSDVAVLRARRVRVLAVAIASTYLLAMVILAPAVVFGVKVDFSREFYSHVAWIAILPNVIFIAGLGMAAASVVVENVIKDKRTRMFATFLSISRGFLWRLVMYQKGAVGGLTLLAASGLGIAALFYK